MSHVLKMQTDDPLPGTPGEEKASTLSYLKCADSMVSVLMCPTFG